MTKPSLLVVAPGRGSYARQSLGYLATSSSVRLQQLNTWRAQQGRYTLSDIDAQPRFQSQLHLAGAEASLLTATCSIADFDAINWKKYELVGLCGNSMGHYTALLLSGVLSLTEGAALIDQMGAYQQDNIIGGQMVYPLCDENWTPVPKRKDILEAMLEEIPDLYLSISLGHQCIIAGSNEALKLAKAQLPSITQANRTFPIALPLHSAFHTPLMHDAAHRGKIDLAHLEWSQPNTHLIGGLGQVWSPFDSDPHTIRDYTLGAQVTETYHFTQMIQNAVSTLAPDHIVLLGPGHNLGGAIAQALIGIGWRGLRTKTDFITLQKTRPFLLSMGRPEQRAFLCP